MITLPYKNIRRIVIDPGEYYASREAEIISTLLGSCVAACLFDPVNRVFGMNHFLLANRHQAHGVPIIQSDEGRYGIYAMELLINAMMKKGADRRNLKAKCFGGGNVLKLREDRENKQTVGDLNVAFIREFLINENIPMVASCLGGNHGRSVHFVGTDYSVFIKRIGDTLQQQLEKTERHFWKKNIEEHEQSTSKTDFW
ncbi:chemotaxis protein CheD [Methylomonas sp. LL1]|uniref:chemotaxis protein CheD n=1 Tax=Methylomonas sp. LL1 TaxID=2785785 RepID=UPI0018C360EB|nr:chemotaxis protein CheD [Methylomonas sp. LL1]QPK63903.1 chemotaxis protein CheD [Methylomonas sp. LL1]